MLHITPDDPAAPHSKELLTDLRSELIERHGAPEETAKAASKKKFACFLIAWFGQRAVGCGALKRRGPNNAEVKHIYVLPSHRNRGIGGEILRTLESHAVHLGFSRLCLEHGHRQPEAHVFYLEAGYQPIPSFGEYLGREHSRCFEKTLPSEATVPGDKPNERKPGKK